MAQQSYGRSAYTPHNHRNSFSAASYSKQFGLPPSSTPLTQPAPSAAKRIATRLPWPCYAIDYTSSAGGTRGKIAVGSFTDDAGNRLQVLGHGLDGELVKEAESGPVLPYPATKLLWEPTTDGREAGMLATTAEYLRLFAVESSGTNKPDVLRQHALLGNTKADYPAPLTSFDWNKLDPALIVTASVDTTCTVWDLNTGLAKTQLIAHDREVFDVAFTCNSTDLFASVGADGSVRLFDLRALEHSTILYECATNAAASPNPGLQRSGSQAGEPITSPLLRLAACPRDANLLATFHAASSVVQVLDIRHPGQPLSTLDAHGGHINALAWQPCSRHLLATCADDAQVLVWDLNKAAGAAETQPLGQKESGVGGSTAGALDTTRLTEPSLVWQGESEVNNLSWLDDGSRLAVSYGRTVQTIKM